MVATYLLVLFALGGTAGLLGRDRPVSELPLYASAAVLAVATPSLTAGIAGLVAWIVGAIAVPVAGTIIDITLTRHRPGT